MYNVMFINTVQQCDSFIHMYKFFSIFFSIMVYQVPIFV